MSRLYEALRRAELAEERKTSDVPTEPQPADPLEVSSGDDFAGENLNRQIAVAMDVRAQLPSGPPPPLVADEPVDFVGDETAESFSNPEVEPVQREERLRPPDIEFRVRPGGMLSPPSTIQPAGGQECPHCSAPIDALSGGGWSKWSSRLSGRPPYQCGACGHRFSVPHRRGVRVEDQESPSISGFLPPEDDRSFHDLIRDIARDEREQRQRPESSEPKQQKRPQRATAPKGARHIQHRDTRP